MGLWNLPWWWHPSVPLSRFLVTKHFVLVPALFNRSASSTDKASRELNSRAFSITFSPFCSRQVICSDPWFLLSEKWLMLKLKLQYSGHLMQRTDSLENTLMLGKIEGRRRRGWMASLTRCTWVWAALGDGEGQGSLACCCPWAYEESDMTEWLNKGTATLSHRTVVI